MQTHNVKTAGVKGPGSGNAAEYNSAFKFKPLLGFIKYLKKGENHENQ